MLLLLYYPKSIIRIGLGVYQYHLTIGAERSRSLAGRSRRPYYHQSVGAWMA